MKIKVSSNKERVVEIRNALIETGGYCPCSLIASEDTKCPCKAFMEQDTPGLCHCGLYEKVEE